MKLITLLKLLMIATAIINLIIAIYTNNQIQEAFILWLLTLVYLELYQIKDKLNEKENE